MKSVKKTTLQDIELIYKLWKKLNSKISSHYSRVINLPEVISENLVCILNNYEIHNSVGGSEDAISKIGQKIQIKATSNFNYDLTSFGPKSKFDILEFVRLDKSNDTFYLYRIPVSMLANLLVNKKQTFTQQQEQKRRPRFSIIKKIIIPLNIEPYAKYKIK